MGYRLGIDLGTTFTSAAVWVEGESSPSMLGLGNRAMQVPSVLFLNDDGEFLVGETAERRGQAEPDRVVREFKRRIGDPIPVLVGGTPFSAQALQARLLRWVIDQATERQGEPPTTIAVTFPANWGGYKRDLFAQCLELAGAADAETLTEPEAVAARYGSRNHLKPGEMVAIYDLGGGTFDAAVLRKLADGFEIVGEPKGIEQLGGIDFDQAVFSHAIESLSVELAAMADPNDPRHVSAMARLRRDCVEAKEALSADNEIAVPVTLPGLTTTIRLVRSEFEEMIRPTITDTMTTLAQTISSAGVEPAQLRAIVLSGGSSRIPLVTHELTQRFGTPLALDTHPKHDVALGAAMSTRTPAPTPRPPATVSRSAPPNAPRPAAGARRRAVLVGSAIAVVVAAGIGAIAITNDDPRNDRAEQAPSTTTDDTSTSDAAPTEPTEPTDSVAPAPKLVEDNELLLPVRRPNDVYRLYIVNAANGVAREVPVDENDATQPRLPVIWPGRAGFLYQAGATSTPGLPYFAVPGPDEPLLTGEPGCSVATRPAFSDDGAWIATMCPGKGDLATLLVIDVTDVTDVGAGEAGDVERTTLSIGEPSAPTWRDNSSLVFTSLQTADHPSGLYTLSTADLGAEPTRLTDAGDMLDSYPDWDPASGDIVFSRSVDDNHPGDVFVLRAGETEPERLTAFGDASQATWSPDGAQIAFLREPRRKGGGTKRVLWLMNADGSDQHSLTLKAGDKRIAGRAGFPAWGNR